MPIRINLKELFPSDAQDLTVDKINFNFNKLLELGIGELGPRGYSGIQGSAGPEGLVGPQGDRGSTWFLDSANDPNLLTFTDLQVGDFYLDSQNFAVWQYNGTSWNFVFDLTAIINNYLAASPSPFVRGLGTGSPADDRFILFSRRGDNTDNTIGSSNAATNDVLFLNNFDENNVDYTSIPGLISGSTGDDYTALLKIFNDSVYTIPEYGRYHLEMGSLYEVSAGNYALTDVSENFKMGFSRISSSAVSGLAHYTSSIFSMDKPLLSPNNARVTNGVYEFRYAKVNATDKLGASVYIGSRYGMDQLFNSSGISVIDGIAFTGEPNGLVSAIGLANMYDIVGIPAETGYISNVAGGQSYFMLDTLDGDINGIYVNKKLLQNGGNIIQVGTTTPRIPVNPVNNYGSPFDGTSFIGFAGIASVGNRIYVVSGDSKLTSTAAEHSTRYGYINRYTIENPNNPIVGAFSAIKVNGATNAPSAGPADCADYDQYYQPQVTPIGIGLSDIDIVGKYAYVTNCEITYDSAPDYNPSPNTHHYRTVFQVWELDSFGAKYPRRISRLGYLNSGAPGFPNSSYAFLNAAYRVKIKGKYAIVGTNALHGPSTSRSYLGQAALAGNILFDPSYYFGHLSLVDISDPASPVLNTSTGGIPTPTTAPLSSPPTNHLLTATLAQAIMDFEIVDDYVVTLTWEQGLDATTYSGHPVSVNVDVFNISGLETDTPAITYKGRSDNALYTALFPASGSAQGYNRLIKFGAVTANKKYIYAAHGKTIKVFAFDQYTISGTTSPCTYTYNEIASFTAPIDGFGIGNNWGIYDIKQLGNSLYVLAIGRSFTNSSGSVGYAFKYDVSGGFGDPATTFGSLDVNGDTIPVWSKEFNDYQVATRLEIIGKHIYASAHGGNGGTSDEDTVQLIPLDFDGIYTAGAHIESLRMDQGYVMGDLEVGQTLTVTNDAQIGGSMNVVNNLNIGDSLSVDDYISAGIDITADGDISAGGDVTAGNNVYASASVISDNDVTAVNGSVYVPAGDVIANGIVRADSDFTTGTSSPGWKYYPSNFADGVVATQMLASDFTTFTNWDIWHQGPVITWGTTSSGAGSIQNYRRFLKYKILGRTVHLSFMFSQMEFLGVHEGLLLHLPSFLRPASGDITYVPRSGSGYPNMRVNSKIQTGRALYVDHNNNNPDDNRYTKELVVEVARVTQLHTNQVWGTIQSGPPYAVNPNLQDFCLVMRSIFKGAPSNSIPQWVGIPSDYAPLVGEGGISGLSKRFFDGVNSFDTSSFWSANLGYGDLGSYVSGSITYDLD